jgi:REP element-mobilizing transposase RayT
MPRHLRVEFRGAIYHVTFRGNARQGVFSDDRDRDRFRERLAESVRTYRIRLYLFCLMDNHMHLMLETPDTNLSRFMQSLETGYTVYYNLRHNSVGHLFQGRYGAKLVAGDEYLLKLSRYVHLNPVFTEKTRILPLKDRLERLRGYQWSSYRSYVGSDNELEYVVYGPILAQVGGRSRRRKRLYREYVEGGLAECDDELLEVLEKSPHAVGGEEFLAWVREEYLRLTEEQDVTADIAFRKEIRRLSTEEVVAAVCRRFGISETDLGKKRRDSLIRPVAAGMLSTYAGLSNRAIARMLGLKSAGSVTNQLRTAARAAARKTEAVVALEKELDERMAETQKTIPT